MNKKLKSLSLTITYRVGYKGLEIPKEIYKQLLKAAENGDEIEIHKYCDVADWMSSIVRERDCMDWKAEIDELS